MGTLKDRVQHTNAYCHLNSSANIASRANRRAKAAAELVGIRGGHGHFSRANATTKQWLCHPRRKVAAPRRRLLVHVHGMESAQTGARDLE
jgi:hypothetical protein